MKKMTEYTQKVNIPKPKSKDSGVVSRFYEIVSELSSIHSGNMVPVIRGSHDADTGEFYIHVKRMKKVDFTTIKELPDYQKTVMILDILDALYSLEKSGIVFRISSKNIRFVYDKKKYLHVQLYDYWQAAFDREFKKDYGVSAGNKSSIITDNIKSLVSLFADWEPGSRILLFLNELCENSLESYGNIAGKIYAFSLKIFQIRLVADSNSNISGGRINGFDSYMDNPEDIYVCRSSLYSYKKGGENPRYIVYTINSRIDEKRTCGGSLFEDPDFEDPALQYISTKIEIEKIREEETGGFYFRIISLRSSYYWNNWVGTTGGTTGFVKKRRQGKKIITCKYTRELIAKNTLYHLPFSVKIVNGFKEAGFGEAIQDVFEGEVRLFENNLSNIHLKEKNRDKILDIWKSVLLLDYKDILDKMDFDSDADDSDLEKEAEYKQMLKAFFRKKNALRKICESPDSDWESLINNPSILENTESPDELIEKIISAKRIFVLQGPPGTGKTTTIKKLVERILEINEKTHILLTSENHDALNHMFEAVKEIKSADGNECYIIEKYEEGKTSVDSKILERKAVIIQNAEKQIEEIDKALSSTDEFRFVYDIEMIDKQTEEARKYLDAVNRILLRLSGNNPDDVENQRRNFYIVQRKGTLDYIKERQRERRKMLDQLVSCRETLSDRTIEALRNGEKIQDSEYYRWKEADAALKRKREIIKDWIDSLKRNEYAFCMELCYNHRIVGATCNKIGDFSDYPVFDWVIIDEAAKVSPADLLIPVSQGKKVLLVGDQNQLPPLLEVGNYLKKQKDMENLPYADVQGYRKLSEGDFKYLLFQYLYEKLPNSNKAFLDTQYRMYYVIGDFISRVFYENNLITDSDTRGKGQRKIVLNGFYGGTPLIWLSTSKLENRREKAQASGSSIENVCEVKVVHDSLTEISRDPSFHPEQTSVIIISGYSAQKNKLQGMVKKDPNLRNLKIDIGTVDSFQGQQADIVILSMVRSNAQGKLGFLKSKERINVAFSRARDLLVIVGDSEFFFEHNREAYAEKMRNYFEDETIRGAEIIHVHDGK